MLSNLNNHKYCQHKRYLHSLHLLVINYLSSLVSHCQYIETSEAKHLVLFKVITATTIKTKLNIFFIFFILCSFHSTFFLQIIPYKQIFYNHKSTLPNQAECLLGSTNNYKGLLCSGESAKQLLSFDT